MNRAFTVTELNQRIRDRLTGDLRLCDLWARGELSNVVNHRSGHRYFTLKDGESQIPCVLFRGNASRLDFDLADGQNVLVFGDVEFYRPQGRVQILVKAARLDVGLGEKHRELERLKERLAAEGLFDAERKRPIPAHPACIGVVTSPDGAALRDVLRVLGACPARIVISPAVVQGDSAPASIASAISALQGIADVIIVGRGGGSAEDLSPFNSELVARAIYQSAPPVVSAVGHETDVTVADFVADLRAPTPSAAAEMVRPDLERLREALAGAEARMVRSLAASLERRRARYLAFGRLLAGRRMMAIVSEERQSLDRMTDRLVSAEDRRMELFAGRLEVAAGKLDSLSPLSTLRRGYSIALADSGVIRRASDLAPGELFELVFAEGRLLCRSVKVMADRS
ncbi:exodeoxyribonuclease VII large subunit [Methanothrix harundinacea]|uniref:Exodeoxyribonuclease VII, large subunit n=1 Tax=Methanothrix harundinacea (strain 6Ac) TaxID=1110509 RepID=G7WK38_METH6|nr:exodeoxyribonuclease VII large subunit [Methanothrix harundinacea]AET64031.1 Exodeoxyribonuclease VII, large subunit [Methanothrix harundinacea 6Ac]